MADVNKTILLEYDVKSGKLIDENGKVIKSLDDLSNGYKNTKKAQEDYSKSAQKTAEQTKALNKLQQDQARSAGLAGAAAFELGRTISDLPFGIVAVTNNISQLGTLMAALVVNAGGLKQGLAALGRQLLGPAGILVGFQVVVAAITMFAQRSNKAKQEVADFNFELEAQAEVLREILRLKQQGAITDSDEEKILRNFAKINKDLVDLLKEGLITEEQKNELIERSIRLNTLKSNSQVNEQNQSERLKELQEELLEVTEKRDKVDRALRRLKKDEYFDTVEISKREEFLEQLKRKVLEIESEKLNIYKSQAEEAVNIGEIESGINKTIDDAIKKKERLLDIEKQRNSALSDLLATQVEEQQTLVDEAILEQDEDKFTKHYSKLLELKQFQLEQQRLAELKDVKDPTTINAINAKYDLLFEKLGKDFNVMFIQGLEDIGKDITSTDIDALYDFGKDSYFTFKKGFTDKFIEEGYQGFFNAFKQAEPEPYFPFVDLLDLESELALETEEENAKKLFDKRKENIDKLSGLFEQASNGLRLLNDIFNAEADKQLAIEQNKTNALNDQLRIRLTNEQLNADQRDKINQQISRNDAALVQRQNEIAKKQFERDKAFKIAMAIGDTASAALKAYSSQIIPFDPTSVVRAKIAAGIATAFGLAQVAALSKLTFTQKALPQPNLVSQGSATGSSGPAFNVVGTSGQNQIAEAISAMQNTAFKTYVVSSDVTTAQELERKIVEGASI